MEKTLKIKPRLDVALSRSFNRIDGFIAIGNTARRAASNAVNSGASFNAKLCCSMAAVLLSTSLLSVDTNAGSREQARKIHDRLAGVPPSETVLDLMEQYIDEGKGVLVGPHTMQDAADLAMTNPAFYSVTLKNIAAPWTNRDQDVFVPLNDYIATYIGLVRDESDFRRILFDDVVYVGNNAPAYSNNSNAHYETLEDSNVDLSNIANLAAHAQSEPAISGLDSAATAGVMTTRAAARAFFVDGTNRAMFRYTVLNHLCYDLEQLKDTTRPADRIRQDISRTPGGDSRLFMNNCVGCHSGMDPFAQAFAYYQFDYTGDPDTGNLIYNFGTVESKYFNNATTFPHGFITPDDSWDNFWRDGINQKLLGWDTNGLSLAGGGNGAKSMGEELANSDAFARCHVLHAFKSTCLREPENQSDIDEVERIKGVFKTGNYNLKRVFGETAGYCSGN